MRREEPEGKDRLKVRKRGVKKGTERKGPSRTESRGEPESVSVWRRSWRRSAPTRLPGRSWSPGGRSQGRAPEAAPGGRRWSGWAEVGAEGRTPQTIVPAGLEWPAGRVAGRALAHRSGRPALSCVRRLRAGAGGGEEGGEQRPRQGGVHPAGARGARGTLLGGAPQLGGQPPAGHGGSSGARRSRHGMPGALWGVAGCPCRTWGVPLGRGSVCFKRGILWGGALWPGRAAGLAEPRGCESARGCRGARRSRSCVAVQGRAGFSG